MLCSLIARWRAVRRLAFLVRGEGNSAQATSLQLLLQRLTGPPRVHDARVVDQNVKTAELAANSRYGGVD